MIYLSLYLNIYNITFNNFNKHDYNHHIILLDCNDNYVHNIDNEVHNNDNDIDNNGLNNDNLSKIQKSYFKLFL